MAGYFIGVKFASKENIKVIIQKIKEIPIGTVIPKPKAKSDFLICDWGTRRGKEALIYSIPNHKNPSKPIKKGVNVDEFNLAFNQLMLYGNFNREWFDDKLKKCSNEGGCNFTTIGGIFVLLGLASYSSPASYIKNDGLPKSAA